MLEHLDTGKPLVERLDWRTGYDITTTPRYQRSAELHRLDAGIFKRRMAAIHREDRRLAEAYRAQLAGYRSQAYSGPQRGLIGAVTRAGRRMLVCIKDFAYSDKYGRHVFHAGKSYAAPDADAARLYPHYWGPSDRSSGGLRGTVLR